MSWIRKWIPAPSGEKVQLAAVESWTVRWTSRYGSFSGDTRPEMEIFTNYEDALHFKRELKAAFKLIRHSSNTYVDIDKN